MFIVTRNFIPPKGFKAINLFGLVLCRDYLDSIDKNHELIHTEQMKELLYVPFYILYILNYIWNLLKYRDKKKAYKNIIFEKEAYNNQSNLDYIKHRKNYNYF